MRFGELISKYCIFVEGKGLLLKEDAPQEAVEAYKEWKDSRPKPDKNGIVTIVDYE